MFPIAFWSVTLGLYRGHTVLERNEIHSRL